MFFAFETLLRLVLAGVLGGLIGYEREHTNRPAGFRTHILVCVGAALVMVTSEYIFEVYSGKVNLDPARLGAQVISGIGFLGAGTIIRDGFNVRGLTTAASLWAVSCVGIAVGIGFYSGAVIATILIFLTLIILKKAEKHFNSKNRYRTFIVESDNAPGQVGQVTGLFEKYSIEIKNIQLYKSKENNTMIKILVKMPGSTVDMQLLSDMQSLNGVGKVYEE
ncbi:MAG TPA: MgtC/SapB family protein [Clostridia bacterium]|nr:MgtC/SapB family protein [Clostridia bacterium]